MRNSYAGNRYTDGDENLAMEDVEDYSSEYYENKPGDAISSSTSHRRSRKFSNLTLILIAVGALSAVLIGSIVIYSGGAKDAQSPSNDSALSLGETNQKIKDFIATLVGTKVLQDPDSLASKALKFLQETHNDALYGNARLQQRFSLACVFLSTFGDGWKNKKGWFSDSDECTWHGVECRNSKLIALNLTDNGLMGQVPMEIQFLHPTLLALELADNEVVNEGEELAWMGKLTNLRMLDVEQTSFAYDGIPPYLSNLKELKILNVADTLFVGELVGSIFEPLQHLIYLEMGGNLYNSSIPTEIMYLPNLEAFYIYDSGLVGDIEFLPNMKKIVEVWLDENPDMEGTIPTGIGKLTDLASFSVTRCDLWGQIPTEFGKLTDLEQAWFYGNWFSGSIPSEFAKLPKLQILGLEDNNITDIMPDSLCSKGMLALSADCAENDATVDCTCCTCCVAPCPAVNLPSYDSHRLLQIQNDIRKL